MSCVLKKVPENGSEPKIVKLKITELCILAFTQCHPYCKSCAALINISWLDIDRPKGI